MSREKRRADVREDWLKASEISAFICSPLTDAGLPDRGKLSTLPVFRNLLNVALIVARVGGDDRLHSRIIKAGELSQNLNSTILIRSFKESLS